MTLNSHSRSPSRTRTLVKRTLACAVHLCVLSVSLRAQVADTLVPRELALALVANLPSSYDKVAELANARVLSSVPAELIPAGAIQIGGIATRNARSQLFTIRRLPSEITKLLNARYDSLGWTVSDPRRFGMSSRAGFVSVVPSSVESINMPVYRCKGSTQLTFRVEPVSDGFSDVTLFLISGQQSGLCRAPSSSNRMSGLDSLMPVLISPPKSDLSGGGGGGSTDSWSTEATLRTSLKPRELIDHYALQLSSAGWTAEDVATSASFGAQRWNRRDAAGNAVFASLIVVRTVFPGDRYSSVVSSATSGGNIRAIISPSNSAGSSDEQYALTFKMERARSGAR